jgi:lactoylglutathione lyase
VGEHLQVRPAVGQRAELGHVVVVMVGEQDMGRRDLAALRGRHERRDRPAGVDEEPRAAALADQVGVRQELRVHRSFDHHRGYIARPMPQLIHTCYRIGDIDRSVAFYEALGFEERRRMPIRDEAINVFMGLPGDGDRLELTYNHGVDSYELGTGYNHIAITADDLDDTLERLKGQGIEPEKPPYRVREGGSRICFVRDPDGYRIELIESGA